ncbi:MAG: helix-turn-helix domain-containing protein [Muribaculaceae bacterium]|nr:helix-turn-helix domain-containing protein [Muribaculaceae bacterium]
MPEPDAVYLRHIVNPDLLFLTMAQSIHIGNLIRRRLDASGMTYTEFARRINCERQSLYYLFGCQSIDINRLLLISKVLDYDFIRNVYLADAEDPDGDDSQQHRLPIDIDAESLDGITEIVIRIHHKK